MHSIEDIESLVRGARAPDLPGLLQEIDVLGIGGHRVVVRAAEGGVWKIPWKESGELNNEIEWRLWRGARPELRELLCPALDRQSTSLLQAACLPISFEAVGAQGKEVVAQLSRWGISDVAVNLGSLDGKIVCYDYAWISPALYESLFRE